MPEDMPALLSAQTLWLETGNGHSVMARQSWDDGTLTVVGPFFLDPEGTTKKRPDKSGEGP